jgi:hypothetical protein
MKRKTYFKNQNQKTGAGKRCDINIRVKPFKKKNYD